MIYIGIDLHRKRSHIAALDEQGTELLSRRVANDPEALRAILGELGSELRVALEATYGWEWPAEPAELLEEEGHELHLSHPLQKKAIATARVKTNASGSLSASCDSQRNEGRQLAARCPHVSGGREH
jgi:transposase